MQKGVPGVPSAVLSSDPFTHDCLTQAPLSQGMSRPQAHLPGRGVQAAPSVACPGVQARWAVVLGGFHLPPRVGVQPVGQPPA